jgi:protease I
MHDFRPVWDIERRGYRLEADLAFGEVSVTDYTAILILGGRAPSICGATPVCSPSSASSFA